MNKAWLEAHFLLEPYDIEVLSNPEREVLDAGGEIHFGLLREETIATFALTPRRKGVMELNKNGRAPEPSRQGNWPPHDEPRHGHL